MEGQYSELHDAYQGEQLQKRDMLTRLRGDLHDISSVFAEHTMTEEDGLDDFSMICVLISMIRKKLESQSQKCSDLETLLQDYKEELVEKEKENVELSMSLKQRQSLEPM